MNIRLTQVLALFVEVDCFAAELTYTRTQERCLVEPAPRFSSGDSRSRRASRVWRHLMSMVAIDMVNYVPMARPVLPACTLFQSRQHPRLENHIPFTTFTSLAFPSLLTRKEILGEQFLNSGECMWRFQARSGADIWAEHLRDFPHHRNALIEELGFRVGGSAEVVFGLAVSCTQN
jgi:hypothetical protein